MPIGPVPHVEAKEWAKLGKADYESTPISWNCSHWRVSQAKPVEVDYCASEWTAKERLGAGGNCTEGVRLGSFWRMDYGPVWFASLPVHLQPIDRPQGLVTSAQGVACSNRPHPSDRK